MTKGEHSSFATSHQDAACLCVSYNFTRVMSGIITGPYFQNYFNLGDFELGTMVAILEIGALSTLIPRSLLEGYLIYFLVTSIAAGRIGDGIGRKMTLFWGAIVFTIGGAIQTFTNGFAMMIVGRLVSGFGVGLLS